MRRKHLSDLENLPQKRESITSASNAVHRSQKNPSRVAEIYQETWQLKRQ